MACIPILQAFAEWIPPTMLANLAGCADPN